MAQSALMRMSAGQGKEGRRRCSSRLLPTVEEADRMNNCRLPRSEGTHGLEPPQFFPQRKDNNPT